MIDPANLNHIKWAIQLFGACRLGIFVDDGMVDQFQAGQPWTTPPTNPEGHDVPAVKFDVNYAYVVTWAGLQAVSWSLMANASFLDEAHAEVYPDWVTASGAAPSGFNLTQLLADLPSVA
jgi:hypothetical protein